MRSWAAGADSSNYNQVRAHAVAERHDHDEDTDEALIENPTSSTLISHNMSPQMRPQLPSKGSLHSHTVYGPLWAQFGFYRLSSVQTEADKQVRSKDCCSPWLSSGPAASAEWKLTLYSIGKDHANLNEYYQLKINKSQYSFCFYLWKWIYFNLYKPCIG